MSSPDLSPEAAARAVRVQTLVARAPDSAIGAAEHWLGALPAKTGAVQGILVTAPADVSRVTLAAMGEAPVFLDVLADLLAATPSMVALGPAAQAVAALRADLLSVWLEVRADGTDLGWTVPGAAGLADVAPLLPAGDAARQALAWAAESGAAIAWGLGRATGTGTPYATVTLPLAGATVGDAAREAQEAFDALGLAHPPEEMWAALDHDAPVASEPGLSLWLDPTGFIRAGFELPDPDEEVVLRVAAAAGRGDGTELGRLAGAAGGRCTALALATLADGPAAEVSFELAEDSLSRQA